ncbi:MAG: hypothetical protein IT561_25920 [Alphaproteobacteria bacterium]|nr:hypothetical protein [Alphaproteobacteria bacterium]
MRRDVVLALGGYRKVFEFAEDYDLWLRVIEAHEISNLDDIVLLHRVHADQISGRRGAQQALAARFARISAAFRRSGRRDPFDDIPKIVPSLAATLGLHPVERRRVAALMTAALMEDRGRKGRPLTSERAAAILRRHLARVLRAPSPDRRPGPVPRPPPASRETGLRTCSPPSP